MNFPFSFTFHQFLYDRNGDFYFQFLDVQSSRIYIYIRVIRKIPYHILTIRASKFPISIGPFGAKNCTEKPVTRFAENLYRSVKCGKRSFWWMISKRKKNERITEVGKRWMKIDKERKREKRKIWYLIYRKCVCTTLCVVENYWMADGDGAKIGNILWACDIRMNEQYLQYGFNVN